MDFGCASSLVDRNDEYRKRFEPRHFCVLCFTFVTETFRNFYTVDEMRAGPGAVTITLPRYDSVQTVNGKSITQMAVGKCRKRDYYLLDWRLQLM